jgi:hypothetical protein
MRVGAVSTLPIQVLRTRRSFGKAAPVILVRTRALRPNLTQCQPYDYCSHGFLRTIAVACDLSSVLRTSYNNTQRNLLSLWASGVYRILGSSQCSMTATARTRNPTNGIDQRSASAKSVGDLCCSFGRPLRCTSRSRSGIQCVAGQAETYAWHLQWNKWSTGGGNDCGRKQSEDGVSQVSQQRRQFSLRYLLFQLLSKIRTTRSNPGFHNGSASTILRVPNDRQSSRSSSPSNIAAKLAAARCTLQNQHISPATRRPTRKRSRGEEAVRIPEHRQTSHL